MVACLKEVLRGRGACALRSRSGAWFGGKSRVAHIVWEYFGDVRNYVEPFFGSGAVLLGRPTEPKIETVNDKDVLISNFWRALQHDPEQLAHWADWPVNEADLHARHLWLVKQADLVVPSESDPAGIFQRYRLSFRERMKTDPDYYDVKIAGWWVWGISQWIGSGWCTHADWRGRGAAGKGRARGVQRNVAAHIRPALNETSGLNVPEKRPYLTNHGGGMGVHGGRKRPRLGNDYGRGVLSAEVPNQIPNLSGDAGAAGRGIHASGGTFQKRPDLGHNGPSKGSHCYEGNGLYEWFYALAERLRRVRVCCGDWTRVLGPAPTTCIGTTGVFLDPPYAVDDRSDVYNEESRDVAHAVREWAIANGDNPELRIALCGYTGEHQMPDSWTEIAWKANGGFANQKRDGTQGKRNAHRERIWFNRSCLGSPLFDGRVTEET